MLKLRRNTMVLTLLVTLLVTLVGELFAGSVLAAPKTTITVAMRRSCKTARNRSRRLRRPIPASRCGLR